MSGLPKERSINELACGPLRAISKNEKQGSPVATEPGGDESEAAHFEEDHDHSDDSQFDSCHHPAFVNRRFLCAG